VVQCARHRPDRGTLLRVGAWSPGTGEPQPVVGLVLRRERLREAD
jgi:hypothetical protein